MKLLFVGDVVGSLGRDMVKEYLPRLKKKYKPQLTIVNGENAAAGRGITEKIYKDLLSYGADLITMGNHTWDNRDLMNFIDQAPKLIRPANFPPGVPGQGMIFIKSNQVEVAVINLQGRVFMPSLDDPFALAKELVAQARKRTKFIFIDFHAEATSEKQALAWYLDGQVSALVGTHTHVQTNDARILHKGTGYLTDVGMTGPMDGILGMEREPVIHRFLTQLPSRFEVVEEGQAILSAVLIELDDVTGMAKKLSTIQISKDHPWMD